MNRVVLSLLYSFQRGFTTTVSLFKETQSLKPRTCFSKFSHGRFVHKHGKSLYCYLHILPVIPNPMIHRIGNPFEIWILHSLVENLFSHLLCNAVHNIWINGFPFLTALLYSCIQCGHPSLHSDLRTEVCLVRSGYFHFQAGWFIYWFASPRRGCFHETMLQRGRGEPFWYNIFNGKTNDIYFCLSLCAFVSWTVRFSNDLLTKPIAQHFWTFPH